MIFPISSEVRKILDIEAEQPTPNELISALLKAPVDLLWNGGICLGGASGRRGPLSRAYSSSPRGSGRTIGLSQPIAMRDRESGPLGMSADSAQMLSRAGERSAALSIDLLTVNRGLSR